MMNYRYCGLTVGERFRMMLGLEDTPFFLVCRAAWVLLILHTASSPNASYHIQPAVWAVLIFMYYFYPKY